MSGHQTESSDTPAAFMGLIGGALFIGIILYGIVLLTNKKFESEKAEGGAEHKAAVVSTIGPVLA
ncbi:MAG: hypothetical protein ABI852_00140 [Gemmatimonadaceae bacterium]